MFLKAVFEFIILMTKKKTFSNFYQIFCLCCNLYLLFKYVCLFHIYMFFNDKFEFLRLLKTYKPNICLKLN